MRERESLPLMREAKRREVCGYCVLFRREVEGLFYLFIYFFFLRRWEAEAETETERLKGWYWVLLMREAERLKD